MIFFRSRHIYLANSAEKEGKKRGIIMKERPTEPHKERGPCVTGSGSDMTQKCPGVFDGSENINTFFLLLFLKMFSVVSFPCLTVPLGACACWYVVYG